MSRNLYRLVWMVAICFGCALHCFCRPASALDTPNTLMGIDAMVINHQGLFRNGTPADGYNTFQFFNIQFAAGTQGKYKSFYWVDNNVNTNDPESFGGLSHNVRMHSDTPESWLGTDYGIVAPLNVTSSYLPIIDRAAFGQLFDPEKYQVEVKFKPNVGAGFPILNEAHTFGIGLDQLDGFVWDAEANTYKRANDSFTYTIGTEAVGINDWYATAPKDANGFATWTVPVTSPSFVQRGFYFSYGNNPFRTANVITGGGRTQNADLTWSDVNDGPDTNAFGSGPTDPNNPGNQLKAPNGVATISMGSASTGPDFGRVLSLEVQSIAVTKIAPTNLVARLDANSGITYRFGSSLSRSNAATPINVPGDSYDYLPAATDQISRFDQNGMTNLILNPRAPDTAGEGYRFLLRDAPTSTSFDGTNAVLNVRARLTAPLTDAEVAQSFTVVAKDLDGNDDGAGKGADEYTYNLALNQFNTSTFTTISVPLSSFALSPFVPTVPSGAAGSGPFGFANPGDGSRTDFNLYEFGGLVPTNGGLLRLELEYMELRLPSQALVGDYNADGTVDAADYTIWRDNLGDNGSLLGANRDPANGSGPVTLADYNSWKAHFGESNMGSGGASTSAVPEPAALSLMAWLFAAAVVWRRTR